MDRQRIEEDLTIKTRIDRSTVEEDLRIDTNKPPGRPTLDGRPVNVNTSIVDCIYCHAPYRNGVMLEKHVAKAHPDKMKIYLCKFCPKTFFIFEDLLKHVLEHWTPGSICPFSDECNCAFEFKRRAAILNHLMNKHLEKLEPIIETRYDSKKSKKDKENPPACKICGKIFSKICLLERHIKIHTKEKPFKCEICGSGFSQKSSLIVHNSIHSKNPPYKCPKCPVAFNQFINLKNHVLDVHPVQMPLDALTCPYCPSVYRKKHTLQYHINKFHKIESEKSEDQLINDTIIDVMNSLATMGDHSVTDIDNIHSNLLSTNDLNLLSNKNPSLLTENDMLMIVSKNVPSSKKCHKCPTCKKVFKKKCDFTRHESVHFNIKPFKCDICSREFRLLSQMKRHKRNMHKTELNNVVNELDNNLNQENITNRLFEESDNILENCIDSLNLSPLEISNQISLESREIFDNVMNNDDDMKFNAIGIDSVNQNNFDADVSLLFNNSSLDSENLNIESNFIVLDSSLSMTNVENMKLDVETQRFEHNKFLEESSILNESILPDNLYLEDNMIGINEVQDSLNLNDCLNFSTSDISYSDTFSNVDLNNVKFSFNSESNVIENNMDVPTISIPNPDVSHSDFNQDKNKNEHDNLNSEITDVDILNFVQVNNVENIVVNPNVKTKPAKIQNSIKSNLAILKEVFVSKKVKYKNPPLAKQCKICPASFKKHCDLVRHNRIHSRVKPFTCKVCGASFSVKCTLTVHERTHKSMENRIKFTCQVCGKNFTDSSALSLHKNIHLERRPHVCPICNATFRTNGHLDTHLIFHLKSDVLKKTRRFIPKLSSLDDVNL